MGTKEPISYEKVLEKCPDFEGVIPQLSWDYNTNSNKATRNFYVKMWSENMRANIKNKLWKKYGSMRKDCVGLGKNKALIGVGAGRSFNKNKHILKWVADIDGVKSWADRDFVIVASNHQFKPLLEMGIIPDFVIVVDASDVMMDQLNKDIPSTGQNSILIAALHCHPKVLKEWTDQGREVRFFLGSTPGLSDIFKKEVHKNPMHHVILTGGNVLNTLWSIGLRFLHARAFMALGNDLSYPLQDTIDKQRDTYYADGDYSSNLANKKDEAKKSKEWMGFTLTPSLIYTGALKDYNVQLDLVGTSPNLWVYKTWIESTVLINVRKEEPYHYFNCSEGGILGVMNKSMDFDLDELRQTSNWFLLDKKCPRWHTYLFKDAIEHFMKAKEALRCQHPGAILTSARNAIGLAQAMPM